MTDSYRHRVGTTVRFGDIDVMGHLNNVAQLRLLETARVAYMVDLGLAGHNELTYVIARLESDFRNQGFFGDELTCGSRMADVGRSSMVLEQRVWREDGTVLLEGRSVLVALGPDKATSTPVPDRWRAKIAEWERWS
jgi:acyl-CoA thioester hydrolase